MKLLSALMKAFKLPGQTLQDFNGEVKALSDKDRNDFVTHFNVMSPDEASKLGITLPVER